MKIIETIPEIKKVLDDKRRAGKTIGLAPTMGYLHNGHLSLVKRAKKENDLVVMSIFVNPAQFSPNEDFDAYPRDLAHDAAVAEPAGADYIFAPEVAEMYPSGFSTYVEVDGPETKGMCAAGRPSHFRGVATVVAKLLEITDPDKAYFGRKDAQQLAVVRRMVKDLNMPTDIVGCAIVREPDGVAMSSRNVYLRPDERQAAVVLYKALKQAEDLIKRGEHSSAKIIDTIKRMIGGEPRAALEYAEVRETTGFSAPAKISGDVLLAVAARFGRARLIDNIIVSSDGSE